MGPARSSVGPVAFADRSSDFSLIKNGDGKPVRRLTLDQHTVLIRGSPIG
jgi:hypothetical protein